MLFFTERKASKELQAYRLTVCAAGDGSVAAMKDGIHARGAREIRQPPPFSSISHRKALTRRAPCACGRRLLSRTYFPHGECWLAERSESKQLSGAVDICFPAEA